VTEHRPRGGPGSVFGCLFLFLVAFGVVVVFAVDTDGDPATTNVPPVVLVGDASVSGSEEPGCTVSEPDAPVAQKTSTVVRRLSALWASVYRPFQPSRGLSIRGP
jgi:hypothetical protein